MRGGYVNPNYTGKFSSAGVGGDYWSSRAYSDTNYAYYLNFGDSSVGPSLNYDRYRGFSLRCLIPTT